MNTRSNPLRYLLVLGVSLLASCQCSTVKLNERQIAIREKLAGIDPHSDPLARNTPIFDAHTHTFDSRYLPLKGVLLGKRDVAPPWSWLISDRCADAISQALLDHTPLSPVPGQRRVAAQRDTKHIREQYHPGLACRIFLDILDLARIYGAWEKGLSPKEQIARLDTMVENMSFTERVALRTATKMLGMEEHMETEPCGSKPENGIKAAGRFLWMLTQEDGKMVQLYQQLHAGVAKPGPIQMISLMMDLGPVYHMPANGNDFLDFPGRQIARMEQFQRESGSLMSYFVAYNPYREDGLKIVQDAVLNHGARGVKVYPPSGYRPAGNAIPPRPRSWLTSHPGRQWDARYGGLGPNPDKTLNDRLEALLVWCIKNDVPVLTHSGHGEFEARKGYGKYHSDPEYWLQFLRAHSKPGAPCRLRLCLGHAGGDDYWMGFGDLPAWGGRAYQACVEYPNVYCEITTGGELLDDNKRAFFVDRLSQLFARPVKPGQFAFSKKLLYGTDWYLPDTGLPTEVLTRVQTAFLFEPDHPSSATAGLRKYYCDYFYNNVRTFMKANR